MPLLLNILWYRETLDIKKETAGLGETRNRFLIVSLSYTITDDNTVIALWCQEEEGLGATMETEPIERLSALPQVVHPLIDIMEATFHLTFVNNA